MALTRGHEAMGRILDALGMKDQLVNRIVIVAGMSEPVHVYVKRFVHEEEFDALADNLIEPATRGGEVQVTTVGGLEVDEKGRVFVPAAEAAKMRTALREICRHLDMGADATALRVAHDALED